jgi:hypothetical protein
MTLPDSVEIIMRKSFESVRFVNGSEFATGFSRIILGPNVHTIRDGAFGWSLPDNACYSFSGAPPPWYEEGKQLPCGRGCGSGTGGFKCAD